MTLKEREILGYALEVLKKNLLMPDDMQENYKTIISERLELLKQ